MKKHRTRPGKTVYAADAAPLMPPAPASDHTLTWHDAFLGLVMVAGAIFAMWSMTGGPMLANYRECGTIFLCQNQKTTS